MFSNFDFDVIRRKPALPVRTGHDVHPVADRDRDHRRPRPRHVDRDDATVVEQDAVTPGGGLRQPDAVAAAGAGDLLVLLPDALYRAMDHRRGAADRRWAPIPSTIITFMLFEAAYYCEIMRAGIQSIPRGQVHAGYALGLNYCAGRWLHRAAAGVPQHAAGAADPDDHPVPGHVAGLRAVDHRLPRRRIQGRAARRPARSRCTCSRRWSISSSASRCRTA